jgi:hypothetical protein
MAAAVEPPWRAVLAATLRQRGVRTAAPAVRAGETLWPLWQRALAVGKDDAAGAQRLLDELAAQHAPQQLDLEADLWRAFLLAPIVAGGTPDQLYAAHEAMNEPEWRAAWARLDAAGRVALLGHFRLRIGTTFVPATPAEAEAIWGFLMRGGEVETAVDTLAMSAAGVACVERHLVAGEGSPAAPAIRKEFAKQLGLDPDTLRTAPGEEWHALAVRLQHTGFAGEWTADERARLQVMRAQCGLAPAPAR